ncbi:MAG: hypothetical protein ABIR80_07780 [Opitutaceae bacterium]
MSQPPPPPSLCALLARAEDFALFSMRARGQVPPTLLADSPAGPLFFVPSSLADERAKNNFANTSRLICVAYAATAAVLIAEAWIKTAAPDGTLDLSVPPSQSLHRREIVILTGESHAGCKQKILPIIRTGAGGFFGFGEFDMPQAANFQGRFAQILPPKLPSPEMQSKARVVLAAMGVSAETLRRDWSDN